MSTAADVSPAGGDDAGEQNPQRRIAIGTQRPGVTPPKIAPRHQYVIPSQPAAKEQAAAADTAAESLPTASAAPAEAPAAAPNQQGDRPPRGEGKPKRERRGGGERKPSFTDVLPPSKRVAVPNLRAALEDDLEEDFQAALEGLAVDDLLVGSVPAKAEATLDPGARVTGTVVSVGHDTAFVDLGGRRQGALKLVGLEEVPDVGDVLNLSVGSRNDDDGLYDVAPANRAVAVEDWSQLEPGMIIEARVTAANKGGLECEVAGLRGFMPASLVSPWRVENLEELVGQTLESLVTEIVPAARRLVLSRRAVIERQAADARAEMLETLEVGTALDGIVRSVRDFGAFVDIGNGVEGLVHVSQLSWDRVANPADVLQPGQKVRVIVKKIDRQTGKIALSARDLVESPWKHAAEKYHVGATVRGAVSRIAQFGAFVRLEPGVEGLVHVSELAHRHVRSVGDVVKEGEPVECRVLACDPEDQRISLSIKALATQPSAAKPADEDDEASEPESLAPSAKKHAGPLKGGLGGHSDGARFGLKW
ncbi:MAG: S1 RNA-binding domain-containing protein [Planctomycetia bacterium]